MRLLQSNQVRLFAVYLSGQGGGSFGNITVLYLDVRLGHFLGKLGESCGRQDGTKIRSEVHIPSHDY